MHNTTDVQTNGMMMIWGCDGVCGDDGGRVLAMVVMTIVVVVTTTVTTTPFALAEGRTPI